MARLPKRRPLYTFLSPAEGILKPAQSCSQSSRRLLASCRVYGERKRNFVGQHFGRAGVSTVDREEGDLYTSWILESYKLNLTRTAPKGPRNNNVPLTGLTPTSSAAQ